MDDPSEDESAPFRTYCCEAPLAEPDPDSSHWVRPKCPACGERTGCYPVALQGSVGGQLCPSADLPDAPARMRTFQFAIAWALEDGRYLDRSRVLDRLDLPDAKAKSVQRGLADACDAGWLELRAGGQAYQRGPLVDNIVSGWTSETGGGA
jgi:hypothetical protein